MSTDIRGELTCSDSRWTREEELSVQVCVRTREAVALRVPYSGFLSREKTFANFAFL